MEEEIHVEQGQWRTAVAPDWLTTSGLGPCIAVIILNHTRQRAWLSHEAGISSTDAGNLREMIADAINVQRNCDQIDLCVLGGDLESGGVKKHTRSDRKCVLKILKESFSLPVKKGWGSVDSVGVIFEGAKWRINKDTF